MEDGIDIDRDMQMGYKGADAESIFQGIDVTMQGGIRS
jgi:hypothetical protein